MTSLSEIYAARVAEGSLHHDTAQEAVLPEFDRIREALLNRPKRGLFRRAPEPPRGLYLWGGVGRGKSMLMDLFVGQLNITGKRRVHFHAFMQEIHAGMHEARETGVQDALAPVAASVVKSVRLLAFD
ncbi:MAG TPA: cell division protein ZapE, partial [Rhodobacteraceae bacterium]|nr:cell division protein ZapE [Paracoccaceae bacterium]